MFGKRLMRGLLAAAIVGSVAEGQADVVTHEGTTITMDFVNIGNAGNAADTRYTIPGYGAVGYTYRMGTYAVTADQWAAVIAADPNVGNAGYWSGSQPTAGTSWSEAAKFCNWLTTGRYDQGYYTISGGVASIPPGVTHAAYVAAHGTTYFIPTEDEWYKAAYHKNNGVTGDYWVYPTGSNAVPTAVYSGRASGTAVFNGNGVAPTAPSAVDNAGGWGPYGTMGQGGNVWEWTEAYDGSGRGERGGSYFFGENDLRASTRYFANPLNQSLNIGFRVASVPESPTLVWTGAVNGTWDVNTTANFSGSPSGTFSDGDKVRFDDTGSHTAIEIAAGGAAPSSVVFANTTAKDYSLSGGPLKGTTSLTVSGGGNVSLTGTNTYTGATTIASGKLLVNSPGSLGATSVTINGGAALGGTGAIDGSVTVGGGADAASQGTIDLADGAVGGALRFTATNPAANVLTLGGAAGNYSLLNFDAGVSVDTIQIDAGKLLINPGGAKVNITTRADLIAGQYNLITFAPGQAINPGGLTLGSVGGPNASLGFSLTTDSSALVLRVGSAPATWKTDGSGLWTVGSNWVGGVPNGVGAGALLGGAITSPQLVYTLTPIKVGVFTLNSTQTYTVTGGAPNGKLTLEASDAAPSRIHVLRGSHLINLPLTFASNTGIDVADVATLTISDPVNVSPGKIVTKLGTGVLVVQSPWTGGSISVAAGTLRVAGADSLPAGSALTISAGGTVVLASGLGEANAASVSVPEPSTLALLGIGAVGLLAYGWRRRKW